MIIKFEVYTDGKCWCARGINADIFTCSDSLDNLVEELRDAAACHFEEELKKGKPLTLAIHTKIKVAGGTEIAPD
ncbi:MAG: type II toxin-antitoxin system HicB family antitoxin [candidate division WOR-3 bacterium]